MNGSLSHFQDIYAHLIESPPAVKRISLFQFFYTLILMRQKIYKTLLFCKKYFKIKNLKNYNVKKKYSEPRQLADSCAEK